MDKGTQNALLYTAGLAAVYLGYKYYKKQQGDKNQAPDTTDKAPVVKTKTPIVAANKPKAATTVQPTVVAPVKPAIKTVAATPKYVQIVKALKAKNPVRFLKDVNASIYVYDGSKKYIKTGKTRLFTINTTLGSTWSAFGFGAAGDKVLIYQGGINTGSLYEIPVSALKLV